MTLNKDDFDSIFKSLDISDNTEKNQIKAMRLNFDEFYKEVRKQPISSFIRALEVKCRALAPIFDEYFNIYYEPMSECKATSGACFLEPIKLRWFRISYPENATEEKIRNIVAHEIGHLYFAIYHLKLKYNATILKTKKQECQEFLYEYLNSKHDEKNEIYDRKASALGVFILGERSDFYRHRLVENQKIFYKSLGQIANDLKRLKGG